MNPVGKAPIEHINVALQVQKISRQQRGGKNSTHNYPFQARANCRRKANVLSLGLSAVAKTLASLVANGNSII
jgi:hypothetical protein